MTLQEYSDYLEGIRLDLPYDVGDCFYKISGIEYCSNNIRNRRITWTPLIKWLGRLETNWHKEQSVPWTAPLFTLDTPVEAVLDYWLDKGLDL